MFPKFGKMVLLIVCLTLMSVIGGWGSLARGADSLFVGETTGVDSTGPEYGTRLKPYRTIQFAIFVSASADVITVFPGRYNESIRFPQAYPVELRSEQGPDVTKIEGTGSRTTIEFYYPGLRSQLTRPAVGPESILDGFTVTCPDCASATSTGGIYIEGQSPTIKNNKLVGLDYGTVGNTVGGIWVYSGVPLIYNNIIAHNRGSLAGGIYIDDFAYPSIYNNTIVDNMCANSWSAGGIYIAYDGSFTIVNNIIADNKVGHGLYYSGSGGSSTYLAYTIIKDNEGDMYGTPLWGINLGPGVDTLGNPRIKNIGGGDYRLTCGSDAFNKGDKQVIDTLTTTDLAGNPRTIYGGTDLGALEYVDYEKQAIFLATTTSGCKPFTVNFINNSKCIDEEWYWVFGDGDTSIEKNPTHEYTESGPYTVVLQAKGPYGFHELPRPEYIVVHDSITADVTADITIGTAPLTVNFSVLSSQTIKTYSWDFGDGTSDTTSSPQHTYATVGSYGVTLSVSNPCGQTMVDKPGFITVFDIPDTFYVDPGGGVDNQGGGSEGSPFKTIQYALNATTAGDVIFVNAGEYNEQIVFPSWPVRVFSVEGATQTTINGDGSIPVVTIAPAAALKPPAIAHQDADYALVGFTITSPAAAESAGAVGGGILISNASPLIKGNIIIDNGPNAPQDLLGGGIYIDGGDPIIYNNLIAENSAVEGGGVYVTGNSNPEFYHNTIVDNTGGSFGSGAGVYYGTSAGGSWKNNIIAYNNFGYGFRNLSGVGFTFSHAIFHANQSGDTTGTTITFGEVVYSTDPGFADQAGGDYRLACGASAFNVGDFLLIYEQNEKDLVGNLRVMYQTPDLGAYEFVDDHKQAAFTADETIGCAPLTVNFVNTSTCVDEQWRWTFGDDGSSDEKNPSHVYTATGIYDVTLWAIGDLDSNEITKTEFIVVSTPGTVDFTANTTAGCVPLTVQFTSSAVESVANYLWDFGDDNTSAQVSPIHVYEIGGRYTVSLTATDACGPGTETKEGLIWAHGAQQLEITSSYDSLAGDVPCSPFEIRFYTVSDDSILTYRWDFADNDTAFVRNSVHTYQAGGTYSVQLITTGPCGVGRADSLSYIVLRDRPVITPLADRTAGCVSLTVNFSVSTTAPINSLVWHFGDGNSATTASTNHTYTTAGEYPVTLTVDHDCGTDVIPLPDTIKARAIPLASFSCPDTGYAPYEVSFTDQSTNGPTSWFWNFGDGRTSTMANPTHTYDTSGVFTITLDVDNDCGVGLSHVEANCVVVGGFSLALGSPTTNGGITTYPIGVTKLNVDTYQNQVSLSATLLTTLYRGSLTTTITNSPDYPSFSSQLQLEPSGDLPSGMYAVEVSATDLTTGFAIADTVTLTHVGQTILSVAPDTLDFDSVVVGVVVELSTTLANVAAIGSGYRLNIDSLDLVHANFSVATPASGSIGPGEELSLTVKFQPDEVSSPSAVLHVFTNDPVQREVTVDLLGRGVLEYQPPVVDSTWPPDALTDVLISDTITVWFSEPVNLDTTYGPTVIVRSLQSSQIFPVNLIHGEDKISLVREEYWPTFDILTVQLVADRIVDSVGNHLDGNRDGLQEGSPGDDHNFSFVTGPGVYPGDTDDDGAVDERDVLPLGLFYGLGDEGWNQGDLPLDSITSTIKPVHLWTDSAATYADADGNGVVDSMDVCPIIKFWSSTISAPLPKARQTLERLASIDQSIIRSIYNAIDYCSAQGPAAATLRGVLGSWLESHQDSPPREFELYQNYPNPFNARTVITYLLAEPRNVELVVFNTRGEKVVVLDAGFKGAGRHAAIWDGYTTNGHPAASGIYFCRLKAGDYRRTRKMTLVK